MLLFEWPEDDVSLEGSGDNFGPDGCVFHGRDGYPYYGHLVRDDYGHQLHGNCVERGGRR